MFLVVHELQKKSSNFFIAVKMQAECTTFINI